MKLPGNAKEVRRLKKEYEQWNHCRLEVKEETMEDLERLIAKQLPTMPIEGAEPREFRDPYNPVTMSDRNNGPRRVTRWKGEEDVITTLLESGSGPIPYCVMLADRWLQSEECGECKPIKAILKGDVCIVTVRRHGKVERETFKNG